MPTCTFSTTLAGRLLSPPPHLTPPPHTHPLGLSNTPWSLLNYPMGPMGALKKVACTRGCSALILSRQLVVIKAAIPFKKTLGFRPPLVCNSIKSRLRVAPAWHKEGGRGEERCGGDRRVAASLPRSDHAPFAWWSLRDPHVLAPARPARARHCGCTACYPNSLNYMSVVSVVEGERAVLTYTRDVWRAGSSILRLPLEHDSFS